MLVDQIILEVWGLCRIDEVDILLGVCPGSILEHTDLVIKGKIADSDLAGTALQEWFGHKADQTFVGEDDVRRTGVAEGVVLRVTPIQSVRVHVVVLFFTFCFVFVFPLMEEKEKKWEGRTKRKINH